MAGPGVFHVVDAVSGKPLVGANFSGHIDTTCCPNCQWGSCSCGSCTSGPGYDIDQNTDGEGNGYIDYEFTTVQTGILKVTAPGYNETTVDAQTGYITGPIDLGVVQLTPLANVPQSNQGIGGTAQAGGQLAGSAAGSASSDIWLYVILAFGALFLFLFLYFGSK